MSRDVIINIQADSSQRDFIDRACKILGKKRSAFILETACREAERILLDQTIFKFDADKFAAFEQALTEPVENNPTLAKLLETPDPWEN